jgi:hypothetical protein
LILEVEIMGFLKSLSRIFASPARLDESRIYRFDVRCNRCGEILEGRIDLWNELSWAESEARAAFVCRKVLMGSGTCFQQIELNLEFDSNRKVIDRHITGGKFIDVE